MIPRNCLLTFAFLVSNMSAQVRISKTPFGTVDGKPVDLYTLTSAKVEAAISTYGGIVVRLKTPDRSGKAGDIVLGFDDLKGYLQDEPYFGALIGRYANRIAKGGFKLDGKEYKLAQNDGQNSLHGGKKGFDKVVWSYPGALFMSAGGYHHHLGTNTWARGAPNATDADARLLEWEIVVPTKKDAEEAALHVESAGYAAKEESDEWVLTDPWGTSLRLVAAR